MVLQPGQESGRVPTGKARRSCQPARITVAVEAPARPGATVKLGSEALRKAAVGQAKHRPSPARCVRPAPPR